MSGRSRAPPRDSSPAHRKSKRLNRFPTEERLAASFLSLPDTVRYTICQFLDVRSVLRLAMTSKEVALRLPWKMLATDLHSRVRASEVTKIGFTVRGTLFYTANGDFIVPHEIQELIQRRCHKQAALAAKEELPITEDIKTMYYTLASLSCILCSRLCSISNFWFGHHLCKACYENGARGQHFKLIPRSDAQVKYKKLDCDQFCILRLRGKSASSTPINSLWERQLIVASSPLHSAKR